MTKQQLEFLQLVTPLALDQQRIFGIPASVTIAQAILESAAKAGWGTSPLLLRANDPFGMRYFPQIHFRDPLPPYSIATDEYVDHKLVKESDQLFRHFLNLPDAFTAHSLLFMSARYTPAYAERGNWQKFAERLGPKTSPSDQEHCGYSTNPGYSAELVKLVQLYRLDDPATLAGYNAGRQAGGQVGSGQLAVGKG